MPSSPEPTAAALRRRSPWRRVALVVLAVLLLAWPVGWIAGSRIARGVLIREAERAFDARLEVGSVQLLPPFWLVASDLALWSEVNGERVDWLRAGELRATLVGWPSGGVPTARVTVDAPVLTVLRTADGVVDLLDRWRGGDPIEALGDGVTPPASARLPVETLDVTAARLEFVDRTAADAARHAETLVIGGFDLSARRGTGASVDLTVIGGDAHLTVDGHGALDLARRTVTIAGLDAHLRVGGAAVGATAEIAVDDLSGAVQLAERTAQVDGATITIAGEPPITARDLRATVALGDGRLDASDVAAHVAGGSLGGTFGLRWDEEPGWQASGTVESIGLADLARRFPQLGGEGVRGALSAHGSFSGALAASEDTWLAALTGSGNMRVRDGRFATIPLVAQLLQQAGMSDAGATLTEASAVFRIAQGHVTLDPAALGSTSVGVQGHGVVGFDGGVRLDMAVMPFGSWRSAVERGNVPVVGGVLASLAGQAQSLVGKASGALYQFHITGTVQNPRLTPVPVPALTKSAASLFDRMASGTWQRE